MPIRPFLDSEDANAIALSEYKDDSTWHFQLAITWVANATRRGSTAPLMYSAIHLRLGIEKLWFEIFEVALGLSVSSTDYEKAFKKSTTLYKLIDQLSPSYQKFAAFTEAVREIELRIGPPAAQWDIARLKHLHGETSERLLHLGGWAKAGLDNAKWRNEQLQFLSENVKWIIGYATRQGNLVVYRPESLQKPEIFDIWTAFAEGHIDLQAVKVRLKIVHPMLPTRRG